jgi:hypothetical protein
MVATIKYKEMIYTRKIMREFRKTSSTVKHSQKKVAKFYAPK